MIREKHEHTYSYSIRTRTGWRQVATGLSLEDIRKIEERQAKEKRTIAAGDFRFNTED